MRLKSELKQDAILELRVLGRHVCYCSDTPSAPAPDPNIGAAAAANAAVAADALDFAKEQYADYKPYLEELAQTSLETRDLQQTIATDQAAQATDYAEYMKNTFRPVEQGLVDEAMTYDSNKQGMANADQAAAEISKSYEAADANNARQEMGFGINPNSGRSAALRTRSGVMEAADTAGARTKAMRDAETVGWAKRMDAASLGRNLPGNQATSAGLAVNAGSAAVNSAGAPGSGFQVGSNLMNQGYGTAIQGNNSAGNLYLGQYGAQLQGYQAQSSADAASSAGIGQLAGSAVGAYGSYAAIAGVAF